MKKIGLSLLCLFCLLGCQKAKPQRNVTTPPIEEEVPQEKKEETTDDTTLPQEEVPTVDETIDAPDVPPATEETAPIVESPVTEAPKQETLPPQETPPPIVEEDPISYVTVSIECHTILNNMDKLKPGYKDYVPSDGYLLAPTRIEIEAGENVYHILERVSQLYNIHLRGRSGYVSGIGNLDESACGNLSGWMYAVNNAYVNVSSSQKVVQDGDSIKWMYTCNNGRDLSFN